MRIIKFTSVADAKRTNAYNDTSQYLLKYMAPDEDEESTVGPEGTDLSVLAMYEDNPQLHKQPRDISLFDEGNPAQKPDIVVDVHRSDSKPYFEKYKGSKSKLQPKGNPIAWRTNDANPVNHPKSKILLCATTRTKWTDKIIEMKSQAFTKPEVLNYVKSLFARKNIQYASKHKQIFESLYPEGGI